MKQIYAEVEKIYKLHVELHGKNIVNYAIVDDVMRKTNYEYNRKIIEDCVLKIQKGWIK